MRNLALALAILCALCAAPPNASADGPLPGIYAGLVGGYTATVDLPESEPDPMGPAIGARAGLVLPFTDLYLGGLFLYHTGETIDYDSRELSSSSFMLGGEVGYQLALGPLVLRPNLGLGYHDRSLDGLSGDSSSVYLSPGVNGLIVLGLMVGAEIRYNAIINDDVPNSVSILGTVGFGI